MLITDRRKTPEAGPILQLSLEVRQEISQDAQREVNGKSPSVAGDQSLSISIVMKPLKTALISGGAGCPAQDLWGGCHFLFSTRSGFEAGKI